MKKNILTFPDIKNAIKDPRFRDSLPMEFREDIAKYLKNPNCSCNHSLYKKILKDAVKQLQDYYPDKEIVPEVVQIKELAKNNFSVINCNINELEKSLKELPPGRKQIAVTRYEDQITVIVNELDMIF